MIPARVAPFSLSEDDKRSDLWRRLSAELERRLQEKRIANDAMHSDIDTAKLRGSIGELRNLLALNNETPIFD